MASDIKSVPDLADKMIQCGDPRIKGTKPKKKKMFCPVSFSLSLFPRQLHFQCLFLIGLRWAYCLSAHSMHLWIAFFFKKSIVMLLIALYMLVCFVLLFFHMKAPPALSVIVSISCWSTNTLDCLEMQAGSCRRLI